MANITNATTCRGSATTTKMQTAYLSETNIGTGINEHSVRFSDQKSSQLTMPLFLFYASLMWPLGMTWLEEQNALLMMGCC